MNMTMNEKVKNNIRNTELGKHIQGFGLDPCELTTEQFQKFKIEYKAILLLHKRYTMLKHYLLFDCPYHRNEDPKLQRLLDEKD